MESSRDLAAAFAVIRQYDPATYRAMQRAQWLVTTDPGANLVTQVMAHDADNTASLGGLSDGTTISAEALRKSGLALGVPSDRAITLIGRASCAEMSAELGQDPRWYLAQTLVHEFTHISQPATDVDDARAEVPAFHAEEVFAAKLPPAIGQPLVARSKSDLASELALLARKNDLRA